VNSTTQTLVTVGSTAVSLNPGAQATYTVTGKFSSAQILALNPLFVIIVFVIASWLTFSLLLRRVKQWKTPRKGPSQISRLKGSCKLIVAPERIFFHGDKMPE
jgi:NADH:ubiquinone oxidoreductase subunit H